MAFGRVTQLDIGVNNNSGVRISNLHFSFEVERSVENEVNYAKISVYNAKEETRRKILVRGNNIFLYAGYKDENNLGLIFSGIIDQSNTKYNNSEYITEIYATDFGGTTQNYKNQLVNFNFSTGTPYTTVIQNITTIIGASIQGINNISNLTFQNGFVFYGTIIQLLKQLHKKLQSNNIGMYFDMGELILYRLDQKPTEFGIVSASPTSGLIGEVEEIMDEEDVNVKRIVFTSLMNPKIIPNSIIRIKSEKLNGAFIVKKVQFVGSNKGDDQFTVRGEALA